MLYWEQDGYMGQSLPSMGERYFLKKLIRATDEFAGPVALSQEIYLASRACHGPFIESSRATATSADTTRRAVSIVVSVFMRERPKQSPPRCRDLQGRRRNCGKASPCASPHKASRRPWALKHQLMSNQGSRQDQAQGEMGLDGQGLGRDDLVIGLVVKVQDLHGLHGQRHG